ncbi:MAG: NRDE family protein [Verrucomicrobia bacterium]|nr:NRDE family protein [Verrucomicrobiota bacterium]
MCTVTFIARKNGFALGMNRDEKLARVRARAPMIQNAGGRCALFPSEPGGGTWVGVNDVGTGFALINWYSISARVAGTSVSRGEVVKSVLAATSVAEAGKILATLPLVRMNAFRLIGFFPGTQEIVEWRWNLKKLVPHGHPWKTNAWISSGFDEPGAQRSRGRTFATALRQSSAGSLPWLRRLHRSHGPVCGPYSTCMHRADAATVSYTEMVVSTREARMGYQDGAPCNATNSSIAALKF